MKRGIGGMRKRMVAFFLFLLAAVGITACGGKEVETQETAYDMKFENQTGKDVAKLEIRYAADADWSAITLTERTWKDGYQMPVSMEGKLPVAENGWQVQMTFEDDTQKIWEGVHFADGSTFIFTLEHGEAQVIASEAAKEVPAAEMDAMEDGADGTTSPAMEETEE